MKKYSDKLRWYFRRFTAMSPAEICWRVNRQLLQFLDRLRFCKKCPVYEVSYRRRYCLLQANGSAFSVQPPYSSAAAAPPISLIGPYDYEQYKTDWLAGFSTDNRWPLDCSYRLAYRNRTEIGDIRLNWELNRHHAFTAMAGKIFREQDDQMLSQFTAMFSDWNRNNPFLWGPAWVSPMEVAIRCMNWCYCYSFLPNGPCCSALLSQLQNGIIQMTDYVFVNLSGYSSANNHLIVELACIAHSGILFHNTKWTDTAVARLTEELPRQNYDDGINKELSLHYHAFYLEAMILVQRLLKKNGQTVPTCWQPMLNKMANYLATCVGNHGEAVEFSDNDEGRIYLSGHGVTYYRQLLGLCGLVLGCRYDQEILDEDICCLFTPDELDAHTLLPGYIVPKISHYPTGGITVLRSPDDRFLIGIDHAALGFGTIAAHGHADALSFQVYADGKAVFADPGTGVYHSHPELRNAFRKTENHNTVCVNGQDQSQMSGPFLWGKKAECLLEEVKTGEGFFSLTASHNGYAPIKVRRSFIFDRDTMTVTDEISGDAPSTVTFLYDPDNPAVRMDLSGFHKRTVPYSPSFGFVSQCTAYTKPISNGKNVAVLHFK